MRWSTDLIPRNTISNPPVPTHIWESIGGKSRIAGKAVARLDLEPDGRF